METLTPDLVTTMAINTSSCYSGSSMADIVHEVVVSESTTAMRFVSVSIGSLGIVLNAIVLIILLSYKPMRSQLTNAFIANLAAIDMTVSVFLILNNQFEYDSSQSLNRDSIADQILCRIWYTKTPLWAVMTSSAYGIAALTFERYLGVVHPLWHRTSFTGKKVRIVLTMTWLVGLLINVGLSYPIANITLTCQCTFLTSFPFPMQPIFGVICAVFQFMLPLTAVIYCYARIFWVLSRRHLHDVVRPLLQPAADGAGHSGGEQARLNVVKMLATVSLFFVVCWSPNVIYFLMFNLSAKVNLSNPFYYFTVTLVYVNSCVNPIIYSLRYRQFQQGLVWLYSRPFCRCCRTSSAESRSVSSLSS